MSKNTECEIVIDVNRLKFGRKGLYGKKILTETDGERVIDWIKNKLSVRSNSMTVVLYPMPYWLTADVTKLLLELNIDRFECKSPGQPGPGHVVFDKGVQ